MVRFQENSDWLTQATPSVELQDQTMCLWIRPHSSQTALYPVLWMFGDGTVGTTYGIEQLAGPYWYLNYNGYLGNYNNIIATRDVNEWAFLAVTKRALGEEGAWELKTYYKTVGYSGGAWEWAFTFTPTQCGGGTWTVLDIGSYRGIAYTPYYGDLYAMKLWDTVLSSDKIWWEMLQTKPHNACWQQSSWWPLFDVPGNLYQKDLSGRGKHWGLGSTNPPIEGVDQPPIRYEPGLALPRYGVDRLVDGVPLGVVEAVGLDHFVKEGATIEIQLGAVEARGLCPTTLSGPKVLSPLGEVELRGRCPVVDTGFTPRDLVVTSPLGEVELRGRCPLVDTGFTPRDVTITSPLGEVEMRGICPRATPGTVMRALLGELEVRGICPRVDTGFKPEDIVIRPPVGEVEARGLCPAARVGTRVGTPLGEVEIKGLSVSVSQRGVAVRAPLGEVELRPLCCGVVLLRAAALSYGLDVVLDESEVQVVIGSDDQDVTLPDESLSVTMDDDALKVALAPDLTVELKDDDLEVGLCCDS